jgi:ABC-2 type transport system ATP-binding protein
MAFEVSQLTKRYGGRAAVDSLTFQVAAGTIAALIGPNGSGKTTTVECMEGLRTPDSGRVRILGLDPRRDRDRLYASLGVQLQESSMHARLRLREALWMFAAFYPRPADPADLLRTYGLESRAAALYATLSGGEKRRFLVALAFAGRPRAVILDEPTTGLDPQARHNVWRALERYRDQGGTVLLTTHLLDEAQEHCDAVAILDHGRLLAMGPPRLLLDQRGLESRVTVPGSAGQDEAWHGSGASHVERLDDRWALYGSGDGFVDRVIDLARRRGVARRELETRPATLEDLFLLLTGREYREG